MGVKANAPTGQAAAASQAQANKFNKKPPLKDVKTGEGSNGASQRTTSSRFGNAASKVNTGGISSIK